MRFVKSFAPETLRPRVNIIFHGLMAFREADAEHYDVLIPQNSGGDHQALYGNPRICSESDLTGCLTRISPDGGPDFYVVEGVYSEAGLISIPAKANALILNNTLIDTQYNSVRAIIRVPKPFIIRHFRGAETHGLDLSGGDADTQGVFLGAPDVVHNVTVFSYFTFCDPRLVGNGTSEPFPQFYHFHNLCIYSQPFTECVQNDSDIFNSMFKITQTGKAPKVNLALTGIIDDGPPKCLAPSVGIEPLELWALSELKAGQVICDAMEKRPFSFIPGGCGSGFLCNPSTS